MKQPDYEKPTLKLSGIDQKTSIGDGLRISWHENHYKIDTTISNARGRFINVLEARKERLEEIEEVISDLEDINLLKHYDHRFSQLFSRNNK